MRRSQCFSSATSAGTAAARPPALRISCATASISDCVRAATTTAAPSPANFRAMARPIPRPPPVMTATFPPNSIYASAAFRVMYTIHHEAHTTLSERRHLEGLAHPVKATGHLHIGGSSPARRRQAMQALVGIWKDRKDVPDSTTYVRRLRKGTRLRRIVT